MDETSVDALRIVLRDTENDLKEWRAHEERLRIGLQAAETESRDLEEKAVWLRQRLSRVEADSSTPTAKEAVEALVAENWNISSEEVMRRLGADYTELLDGNGPNVRRRAAQYIRRAREKLDKAASMNATPAGIEV